MTMNPTKKPNLEETCQQVIVQFYNADQEQIGPEIDIPDTASVPALTEILNSLQSSDGSFLFYMNGLQVTSDLRQVCTEASHSYETVIPLTVHPQSMYRVSPATRATSCLEGHTESILSVQFSPDGSSLASSSGDTTVRLWDIQTETPLHTMEGHKNWVLLVSWNPTGDRLASSGADGTIRIWAKTGEMLGKPLIGHRKWVTSISWQPYHRDSDCSKLASASKDSTFRVWDTLNFVCLFTVSAHANAVTKVLWGGEEKIYTCSQDRFVKVWDERGKLVNTLKGHGHWVNHMSVSTEFVLRTAYFDPFQESSPDQKMSVACERYSEVRGKGERLVSCSDDLTLFLWNEKGAVCRMNGHQQLVNHVAFSPDGHFVVSGSYDKSIKLWDGFTGKFLCNFRGHVAAVYQVVWSPDSGMVASASKDSTIKIWSVKSRKLIVDLPGHADQVYALDWSPDGAKLASGSKDRILSIWRN